MPSHAGPRRPTPAHAGPGWPTPAHTRTRQHTPAHAGPHPHTPAHAGPHLPTPAHLAPGEAAGSLWLCALAFGPLSLQEKPRLKDTPRSEQELQGPVTPVPEAVHDNSMCLLKTFTTGSFSKRRGLLSQLLNKNRLARVPRSSQEPGTGCRGHRVPVPESMCSAARRILGEKAVSHSERIYVSYGRGDRARRGGGRVIEVPVREEERGPPSASHAPAGRGAAEADAEDTKLQRPRPRPGPARRA